MDNEVGQHQVSRIQEKNKETRESKENQSDITGIRGQVLYPPCQCGLKGFC